MEEGLREGLSGDLALPRWMHAGDARYDGLALVLDHTQRNGLRLSIDTTPGYASPWQTVAIGVGSKGYTSGVAVGHTAQGYTLGVAIGTTAKGYTSGVAVGHTAQGYTLGVAIGTTAKGYLSGVAVGYTATGHYYGVAVGRLSSGYTLGVAVGSNTTGYGHGVAIGRTARGHTFGVAVGYTAYGETYGVSIGYQAKGQLRGVAIGSTASGAGYTVSIGHYAGKTLTTTTTCFNVFVGNQAGYAGNGVTTNHFTTSKYGVCIGATTGLGSATQHTYITCLGFKTHCTAAGAVAIGVSTAGVAASATLANQIALGTTAHLVKFSNNTTGTGTALLGSNCPAVTASAPFTWIKLHSKTGTVVYAPVWK